MEQPRHSHAATRFPRGRLRYFLVALVAVIVLVGGITTLIVRQVTSTSDPAPGHASTTAPDRRSSAGTDAARHRSPATFLGPDGVEASWVIAENKRPGTTAWQIPPNVAPNQIEGFTDLNYAAVGNTAELFVSTPSPTFRVVAYRMGWYQGKGARQVWASGRIAGHVQPVCPLTPTINMVSCDNWTPSLSVPITKAFVQGDYLLKLEGSGGQQGYIPLTVWDPDSDATYLVINRTFTEEAWNFYGGYSFYQGEGACAPDSDTYPVCNRARVASFDRPYNTGDGASDFMGNEFPLIQFCEEHGLDVTYVTDVTLDADPQIALRHRVLFSLGHDEVWTYNEREAAVTAESRGVNVVFFGAASVLRHARLQPSPLGPDREEVDYRDSSEDPLNGNGNPMEVTGNTWSSPPTNWSEVPFVGENYSGYLNGADNVPFVVYDAAAWIFKGTGLSDGSQLPGVILSDVDHLDPSSAIPADLQVLGHSPIPASMIYTNQGVWGNLSYSDMTYYTDPHSQAGILDTGTVNWIYSMNPCVATDPHCPAPTVRKMTGNLLRLFGQGPAGRVAPSQANWQAVSPQGS
jgi:hypothetical protein